MVFIGHMIITHEVLKYGIAQSTNRVLIMSCYPNRESCKAVEKALLREHLPCDFC